MGSPGKNRLKSGPKREIGDMTEPFFAVWVKKNGSGGLLGETSGDALTYGIYQYSYILHTNRLAVI
jgi:hypothetical protein